MSEPYEKALDRLTPAGRRILLHAALWPTGGPSAALVARSARGCDLGSYSPAEQAGLITIGDDTVVFAPGVADALVRRSTSSERRQAHRDLAAALAYEPGRQAWHRATAADDPPADRARLYEQAAGHFSRDGRPREAAFALQLAAEVASGDPQRPERLVRALELVVTAGDGPWAARLAGRIARVTTDVTLTARAARAAASSLIMAGEPRAAFETVRTALTTAPVPDGLAGELFSVAARSVLASGSATDRSRLAALAALVPAEPVQWSRRLSGAPGPDPGRPPAGAPPWVVRDAGLAAWLYADPRTALKRLRDPLDHLHPAGEPAPDLHRAFGLVLTLIDNGSWDEAEVIAGELAARAATGRLDGLAAGAGIALATIKGLRGDGPAAESLLAAAIDRLDLEQNGFLRMLAVRVRAITAIASGDFPAALVHYCGLFHSDGRPAVHWAADRLVSEFALAARRAGDTTLVRRVADRIRRGPEAAGPRLRFALDFTDGVLAADPEEARRGLRAVAIGPTARDWPGDRAVALLLYGLQLRRERRFTEAEPLLRQALEQAHQLGAQALIVRAQGALRANGTTGDEVSSAAFGQLTAQQQDIVRLAAEGLRNREIAARLHLSERTIGSHLYHIFPKLGVAGRRQLRKVVDEVS